MAGRITGGSEGKQMDVPVLRSRLSVVRDRVV